MEIGAASVKELCMYCKINKTQIPRCPKIVYTNTKQNSEALFTAFVVIENFKWICQSWQSQIEK